MGTAAVPSPVLPGHCRAVHHGKVAWEVTATGVVGIRVSSPFVHPCCKPGCSQPALHGILIQIESARVGMRSPDPAASP